MNKLNCLKALILSAMLFSVLGCASTANRQGTGEFFDDTVITSKVKSAIFSEASLKSSEINVETYKGLVQLSGFVGSKAEKATAAMVAGKVNGVKSVSNDLLLK